MEIVLEMDSLLMGHDRSDGGRVELTLFFLGRKPQKAFKDCFQFLMCYYDLQIIPFF